MTPLTPPPDPLTPPPDPPDPLGPNPLDPDLARMLDLLWHACEGATSAAVADHVLAILDRYRYEPPELEDQC